MSIYLGTNKVSQSGPTSSSDSDLSNYYNKDEVDQIADTIKQSVENVDQKIVQSDWSQEDSTSMAFIKNKPSVIASSILTNMEIDQILQ